MSPSRILGFRQSTWVVFFLLTVPIWSMFGYQLLLIILNLITTIFFRIPLEKLLPKDSFVLSEYWMNLHLPLWVALFFVKNISRRLCAEQTLSREQGLSNMPLIGCFKTEMGRKSFGEYSTVECLKAKFSN